MTALVSTIRLASSPAASRGVASPMSQASEIALGKSHPNHSQYFRNLGNISEAKAEKIVAFLRELHPEKTAECVAADRIASVDTVRKWLAGTCAPSLAGYSRMVSLYGLRFLLFTMDRPQDWLVRAARDEERARLEARRAEVERQLAELRA